MSITRMTVFILVKKGIKKALVPFISDMAVSPVL